MSNHDPDPKALLAQASEKSPYQAPSLTVHGRAAELTQGSGAGIFDVSSFGLTAGGGGQGGFS